MKSASLATLFCALRNASVVPQTVRQMCSAAADPANVAVFAGGCFWGVEHFFKKEFKDALRSTTVGYVGGHTPTAVYEEVKTGRTGHAEAVRLDFDPAKTDYAALCEHFFRIHNPTEANRQGPDVGTQYRSAIFPLTPEQRGTAKAVLARMNQERWKGQIVTEIRDIKLNDFIDAEDYHQDYLDNNPEGWCVHKLYW